MISKTSGPRILVSGLGSIRETVLMLPIASALRDHFADAQIIWAVHPESASVVTRHRAINQKIELSHRWWTSPRLADQARRRLKNLQIDLAIDCQNAASTALAGWLSGAPRRIGFASRRRRELSSAFNNVLVQPVFNHLTDRTLELLVPLEIHSPKVRWDFPLTEASRNWATRWRRTIAHAPLAVMNPGSGSQAKIWPCERYAATARYLADHYGYRTIVTWGNDRERQLAQKIAFQSKGAATYSPDTDLQHLAALIEQSDLFVGADSGPLHIAVAVNTPAIGLYGASCPRNHGPYGHVAIGEVDPKQIRQLRKRSDDGAMKRIDVGRVCQAIDKIEAKRDYRQIA